MDLGYTKKQYEEFVYKYNYFFERLNRSGEVFFGDEISDYLNQLKDYLLDDDPLKDEVTIYFTQNPTVNAFTNDFGSIYMNAGLLAKLKNEAELLAIIAHEITHVKERHTHQFESFQKKKGWQRREASEVLSKHQFSQGQEFEADSGAMAMLTEKGISIDQTFRIYELLEYNADPVIPGRPDMALLAAGDAFAERYWLGIYNSIGRLYLGYDSLPEPQDSLETHPSPSKRLKVAQEYHANHPVEGEPPASLGNFDHYQGLAQQILLRSYLREGRLQSGLHLTLKMREEAPDDLYLAKLQAKFMTLVVQDKYNGSPWDQVLNLRGRNQSEPGFLHFREASLSINPFEYNLLALIAVKRLQEKFNDPYLDRVDEFLHLFLHKYNFKAFAYTDSGAVFTTKDVIPEGMSDVAFHPEWVFLTPERKAYDQFLAEISGMVDPLRGAKPAMKLWTYYRKNMPWDNKYNQVVRRYRKVRDGYEKGLTIDQFSASLHPKVAFKNYRKPKVETASNYDPQEGLVLVNVNNFRVSRQMWGKYQFDHEAALEMEQHVADVMPQFMAVTHQRSGLMDASISIKNIQDHQLLKTWIQERYQLNDLVYSRVDEEIEQLRKDLKVNYLVSVIHSRVDNRLLLYNSALTTSILTYYDLDYGSIVYVSKNATTIENMKLALQQIYYLRTIPVEDE
ncbi:MAG: M48 family metallopeptidase [Salibacteraceae bacterium]